MFLGTSYTPISPKHVIVYPTHIHCLLFHFPDLYSVTLPELPNTAIFPMFHNTLPSSTNRSPHPDGEKGKQEADIHHIATPLAGPSRAVASRLVMICCGTETYEQFVSWLSRHRRLCTFLPCNAFLTSPVSHFSLPPSHITLGLFLYARSS